MQYGHRSRLYDVKQMTQPDTDALKGDREATTVLQSAEKYCKGNRSKQQNKKNEWSLRRQQRAAIPLHKHTSQKSDNDSWTDV